MKRAIFSSLIIFLALALVFSSCTGDNQTTSTPDKTTTTTSSTATTSAEQSAEEFYEGKVLTFSLGIGAGGGSDLQARVLASFLGPEMGANIGVVNDTSAGGLVARNNFANNKITKPDGLTLMYDPAGMVTSWLLKQEGVEYDCSTLEWLGALNCAVSGIVVNANGPYQTVEDLKAAKDLKFGASQPASLPTLAMLAAIEIMELDATVVSGYSSASDRRLALEQGEIDAMSNTIDTAWAEWESTGKAKILFSLGLERDPSFEEVPCIAEYVDLTDYHKELIAGVPNDYKMFFAPPNTPEDRVDYLRASFLNVSEDAGYQKAIKSISTYWQGAVSGEDLEAQIKRLGDNQDRYIDLFGGLIDKYCK